MHGITCVSEEHSLFSTPGIGPQVFQIVWNRVDVCFGFSQSLGKSRAHKRRTASPGAPISFDGEVERQDRDGARDAKRLGIFASSWAPACV